MRRNRQTKKPTCASSPTPAGNTSARKAAGSISASCPGPAMKRKFSPMQRPKSKNTTASWPGLAWPFPLTWLFSSPCGVAGRMDDVVERGHHAGSQGMVHNFAESVPTDQRPKHYECGRTTPPLPTSHAT
jgi:hypothetical protein